MRTDTLAYWPSVPDESFELIRAFSGSAEFLTLAPKFGPWFHAKVVVERQRRMVAKVGSDATDEDDLLGIGALSEPDFPDIDSPDELDLPDTDAPYEAESLTINEGEWSTRDLAEASHFIQHFILCVVPLLEVGVSETVVFLSRIGLAIAKRLMIQVEAAMSDGVLYETVVKGGEG